ncbi:hypothetical protein LVJ82_11935 [Vitreoscilla massiliensis]|uniref:Uncharacterized protein n=1 Tax=Vitreoscilla massiliensis TaxID=1689272 RepID=A0ABY4DXE4_9NEIS|nr:hypothetical protein [Vitreoscilla massiliensis]UOO88195.1 hypothetical protein LVJ82_11935 [Vitreoscilla massiliensis]
MNKQLPTAHAEQTQTLPDNTPPFRPQYPTIKVLIGFSLAPVFATLMITLLMVIFTLTLEIFIYFPMAVYFAMMVYGIPAFITGAIISANRWHKDGSGMMKATLTGMLCSSWPILLGNISFLLLGMAFVAAVTSHILAHIVLPQPALTQAPAAPPSIPNPETPALTSELAADEASAIPTATAPTDSVYYLKDLPRFRQSQQQSE